jgi:hypothetical protein
MKNEEHSQAKWDKQTHCRLGHEYTVENTYVHATGRYCRICHRMSDQRRADRRKLGNQVQGGTMARGKTVAAKVQTGKLWEVYFQGKPTIVVIAESVPEAIEFAIEVATTTTAEKFLGKLEVTGAKKIPVPSPVYYR